MGLIRKITPKSTLGRLGLGALIGLLFNFLTPSKIDGQVFNQNTNASVYWNNNGFIQNNGNQFIEMTNQSFISQDQYGYTIFQNINNTYATPNWGIGSNIQNVNVNGQGYYNNNLGFYVRDKNGNLVGIAVNTNILNIDGQRQSNFGFNITIGNAPYLVVQPSMLPYLTSQIPQSYQPIFNNYKTLPQYVMPLPSPQNNNVRVPRNYHRRRRRR